MLPHFICDYKVLPHFICDYKVLPYFICDYKVLPHFICDYKVLPHFICDYKVLALSGQVTTLSTSHCKKYPITGEIVDGLCPHPFSMSTIPAKSPPCGRCLSGQSVSLSLSLKTLICYSFQRDIHFKHYYQNDK